MSTEGEASPKVPLVRKYICVASNCLKLSAEEETLIQELYIYIKRHAKVDLFCLTFQKISCSQVFICKRTKDADNDRLNNVVI